MSVTDGVLCKFGFHIMTPSHGQCIQDLGQRLFALSIFKHSFINDWILSTHCRIAYWIGIVGENTKKEMGKNEMNERAAVNTKGQEPKILFRRVKWKQIIYRIFLSPPPLLLEKGWDKPTAMDFWFSRHLNCLLGKFKYYGTSPSTFIWPKMPKICTFLSGKNMFGKILISFHILE